MSPKHTVSAKQQAKLFAMRWNRNTFKENLEPGCETEIIRKYRLSNSEVDRMELEYSCIVPLKARIVSVGKTIKP